MAKCRKRQLNLILENTRVIHAINWPKHEYGIDYMYAGELIT